MICNFRCCKKSISEKVRKTYPVSSVVVCHKYPQAWFKPYPSAVASNIKFHPSKYHQIGKFTRSRGYTNELPRGSSLVTHYKNIRKTAAVSTVCLLVATGCKNVKPSTYDNGFRPSWHKGKTLWHLSQIKASSWSNTLTTSNTGRNTLWNQTAYNQVSGA